MMSLSVWQCHTNIRATKTTQQWPFCFSEEGNSHWVEHFEFLNHPMFRKVWVRIFNATHWTNIIRNILACVCSVATLSNWQKQFTQSSSHKADKQTCSHRLGCCSLSCIYNKHWDPLLGDTKCELWASPAGLTSKERELHNLLMQAEKHSIWPLTHSHPQIHSQKAESERKTGMLYSTCHGVKLCYYICASESQRSLSRAPDLPLSAHSLIPVIKPTSCSHCCRCYFTEASLSTWISVLQS